MAVVYAPITGQTWSLDCYCNITSCPCGSLSAGLGCNSNHICKHCPVSGSSSPIDVGGASAGAPLYLYTDCQVQSVVISQFTGICPGQSNSLDWAQTLQVDLWSGKNATGTKYGSVIYHHVAGRIASGTYNNPDPTGCLYNHYYSLQIGSFTTDCRCGCYSGIHVHMQRIAGSTSVSTCNGSTTGGGGGTVIYSY